MTFEITTQAIERTLIDKVFAICDYYLSDKIDRHSRQNGNPAEIIGYADKANTRLRSRYYKFTRHGKAKNVAVAAVARESACSVWGMMTDNTRLEVA